MDETKKDTKIGRVKMFNGIFGFIEYSDGDIFFHNSAICDNWIIGVGDNVSFTIAQSSKKKGNLQAENITVISCYQFSKKIDLQVEEAINSTKNKIIESNKRSIVLSIGKIKWYSDDNDYGVIIANNSEYFFRKENINKFIKHTFYEGNACIFVDDLSSHKKTATKVFKISESDYLNLKPILSDFDLLSAEIGYSNPVNSFHWLSLVENIKFDQL